MYFKFCYVTTGKDGNELEKSVMWMKILNTGSDLIKKIDWQIKVHY